MNCTVWFLLFTILIFSVSLYCCSSVDAQRPDSSDKSSLAKNLIVKVTGENNFGAGIIFDTRGNFLFIVTANHIFRGGIKDINVEFACLRGVPIKADLIYSDNKIDLAVLRVDLQDSRLRNFSPNSIPFDLIGDTCNLKMGDLVYPIGHPAGEEWYIPMTQPKVSKVVAEQIHFEYSCSPGYSGGGLFNDQWNLVGMITRSNPLFCEALSFERICATLSDYRSLPLDTPRKLSNITEITVIIENVNYEIRVKIKVPDQGSKQKQFKEIEDFLKAILKEL